MPYRIDIASPPDDALDQLVQLGALDVESLNNGIAAIMPDSVSPQRVAEIFGVNCVTVSHAMARDDGSVWILAPRPLRIGSIRIVPPGVPAPGDALTMVDSSAFGTGHHPTTALSVEVLEEILHILKR